GTVVAAVLVAGGRRGEGYGADDEQVVVLPPAHDRQGGRGGRDNGDCPVEPAPGPDVPWATFVRQGGDSAGKHGRQPGHDVQGQEGEEGGGGRAHLIAQDAAVSHPDLMTPGAGHAALAAPVIQAARAHGWCTPAWLAVGTTRSGAAWVLQEFVPGGAPFAA